MRRLLAAVLAGLVLGSPAAADFIDNPVANAISGTLTTNKIPKASGANTLTDGSLTDDGSTVTSTVTLITPDTATAIRPNASSTISIGWSNANHAFDVVHGGVPVLRLGAATGILLADTWQLRFLNGTVAAGTSTSDTVLMRAAANNLRIGLAAANPPVAQTLSVQNASGTDIAGANFTIDASQGTGTGAGGSIIFRTAAAGVAGSSLNALATLLTVGPTNVTLASGQFKGPNGTPTHTAPTYSFTVNGAAGMTYDVNSNVVIFRTTGASFSVATDSAYAGGVPLGLSSSFNAAADVLLYRDAANVLAQRNGTNAQTFRLYKTYTDGSNYTAAEIGTDGNGPYIKGVGVGAGANPTFTVGGGAGNNTLYLSSGDVVRWQIPGTTGHFLTGPAGDNLYDIGASGATRPRTIYAGTSIVLGSAANGAATGLQRATTVVAAAAGASITTATTVPAGIIPAGARVAFVVTRITTAFGVTGGLASIDIGDGTDVDLFGNDVAITLDATTNGAQHTATPGLYAAATHVVLTGVGGTFDTTGAIRVTVFYWDSTAPTS